MADDMLLPFALPAVRRKNLTAGFDGGSLSSDGAGKPVEVWFQDEAHIGQQGTLARVWARKGSRPRAPRDRRYDWAYIFGAPCPQRGAAALVLPSSNAEAFNLHLAEISKAVAPGPHAVVIMDGAGYHGASQVKAPANLTLIKLPPYSSELNPAENIWEYLRKNKLANSVWETYEEILEGCCEAWRFFADHPNTVTSITTPNGQRSISKAVGIITRGQARRYVLWVRIKGMDVELYTISNPLEAEAAKEVLDAAVAQSRA